ncbi:MAG: response regulator [Pseudomonadota bacterium]|nr:response regulator [Pseudomonadota bacterium]
MSEEFSKHKILVVDDEILLVELLAMQLEGLGCPIVTANNGEEALEKLESNVDVSLIISDVKMPIMDGITFLKRIRERGSVVPVMFFSAYGDRATLKQAWKEGAFDFLEKPINEEDLVRKVKLALLFGKEFHLTGHLDKGEKK